MAVSTSTLCVVFALLSSFGVLATGTLHFPNQRSAEGTLERRIFSVISGNGTFSVDCGSDCNRKLFLMASCSRDDTFMELIDQDLDVWLTKMENKLLEIERVLSSTPSKQQIKESIEAIEAKLQIFEQKLIHIL